MRRQEDRTLKELSLSVDRNLRRVLNKSRTCMCDGSEELGSLFARVRRALNALSRIDRARYFQSAEDEKSTDEVATEEWLVREWLSLVRKRDELVQMEEDLRLRYVHV